MTLQAEKTQQRVDQASAQATGQPTVTLRDESDQIIDDLKFQLSSLQGQLADYQAKGSQDAAQAKLEAQQNQWNRELTPRITQRMELPAQELTHRLERLILQVSDPELKAELMRCRETADYLFQTFRQITHNHRILTESLTLKREQVASDALLADLHRELQSVALDCPITLHADLPGRLDIVPQAAVTLVRILSQVARELMGEGTHLILAVEEVAGETKLAMNLHCQWNWIRGKVLEDVSAVVFKPGVTPSLVVDWLYMEKIIELQQGDLGFLRENGQVAGFCIRIPL